MQHARNAAELRKIGLSCLLFVRTTVPTTAAPVLEIFLSSHLYFDVSERPQEELAHELPQADLHDDGPVAQGRLRELVREEEGHRVEEIHPGERVHRAVGDTVANARKNSQRALCGKPQPGCVEPPQKAACARRAHAQEVLSTGRRESSRQRAGEATPRSLSSRFGRATNVLKPKRERGGLEASGSVKACCEQNGGARDTSLLPSLQEAGNKALLVCTADNMERSVFCRPSLFTRVSSVYVLIIAYWAL